MTWAGIARAVFEARGRDAASVRSVTTAEYAAGKSLAPRPQHSVLNLDKIISSGFQPADAMTQLQAYVSAPSSPPGWDPLFGPRTKSALKVSSSPAIATPMKPACAPQLSITWPTATAPAATPAAKPVELHAKASVRRLWSTADWVTPTDAIRVGAKPFR